MKRGGSRGLGFKAPSEMLKTVLSLSDSILKIQYRFDNQTLEPMNPRILEPLATNLL